MCVYTDVQSLLMASHADLAKCKQTIRMMSQVHLKTDAPFKPRGMCELWKCRETFSTPIRCLHNGFTKSNRAAFVCVRTRSNASFL